MYFVVGVFRSIVDGLCTTALALVTLFMIAIYRLVVKHISQFAADEIGEV